MPAMYDQTAVYRIQQANDIVDVVSEHVSLKKKGREMVGLCPFHDDQRPSLYVNETKQIFKCFACGAGGDVLKFVQMRENLTFPQAIERLAERAGIKLKSTRPAKTQTRQPSEDVDPNLLAKVNAWAAKFFQGNLNDPEAGADARRYIAERGISPETAKTWQLGLAVASPDALARAAGRKGIPGALLEQAGLVAAGNQDKFVNRLMFTITDVTGRVIGFGGRTLDQIGAKYINSPTTVLFDKSSTLYGIEQARHQIAQGGTAVAVEGYTDCIMAHQFGCSNVVATLGTSFTTGHGRILRRYAKKVVLLFDSDTAGLEAANRALEVCLSQRLDISLAFVPQGKDPCDFLLAAGKEQFDNLVNQATDVLQFKWDRLNKSFAADRTLAGMKAAVDEFLQVIAVGLASGNVPVIDTGIIINRLSRIIGLDNKQLYADLDARVKKIGRSAGRSQEQKQQSVVDYGQGLAAAAQREVLEVLLNKPDLFAAVGQRISQEDFDVPILRQAADTLFAALKSNACASVDSILAGTDSRDVANCITELAFLGEKKGNYDSRLSDAIDALQRCRSQGAVSRSGKDPAAILTCGGRNPHSLGMM